MSISNATSSPSARTKSRVLLTATLVTTLITLDSNIVAVSLPAIARSLDASFADIQWAVGAYILTFAALLMAAGAYADRHGRKRVMLAGLVVFAVASATCGLATSSLMLNLSRAVQGVGGAMLLTAAIAVITHAFEGAERARAYAFWGSALGLAMTVGPIVGGLITHFFGWRWVFLINVPVCAALFLATSAVIGESSDHEAKRIDIAGISTFTMGLFLMIWALIDGNAHGWTTWTILSRFCGAAVLLALFVVAEASQERPMVDFALFRRPAFLGSAFAMVGYAGAAQVMIFYLPLQLQNVYGLEPAAAGLAMLPFAFPMFLAPRVGTIVVARHGSRTLLTMGLTITALGDLSLWAAARSDVGYPVFVLGMLVAGSGAGLLNGETAKVMQAAVPAQRAGMASGVSATTRFTALLIGVAGLGAVLNETARGRFGAAAAAAGLDPVQAAGAARYVSSGNAAALLKGLPEALHGAALAAARTAFTQGFAVASLLAAVVALLACLATVLLVRDADTASAGSGDVAIAPE